MEQSPREHYVESLYAREDEGLRAIRERLMTAGRWGINISPNEGLMLQVFVRMIQAKKIVEIGTLFGYSSVWLARALSDGGKVHTIERDHECVRMARKAFEECGVESKVEILEGEATDQLKHLEAQAPFDLVFIDANKSAYVEYLDWATKNVRSGGLIVADNTLLGGGVAESEKPESLSMRQWTEMRKFNEAMADRRKYFATILPTTEGLTVAVRL